MDQQPTYGYRHCRKENLEFLYGGGWIRHLRIGGTTVIQAVYAAVRDRNWGTAPLEIEKDAIRETPEGYRIRLEGTYRLHDIVFRAAIGIQLSSSQMDFTFEGTARTTFMKNRIGLCILHPVEPCRGKPVKIEHTDGSTTSGIFPELISPHQPFREIRGMTWHPSDEVSARLRFSGDTFEMEDHRNWTDASYKTYSTPLEIPFPVKVEEGTVIRQAVHLHMTCSSSPGAAGSSNPPFICICPGVRYAIPQIGVARPLAVHPATNPEPARLADLRMDHYRADIHLDDPGWERTYESIAETHRILTWPVQLALHFGANASARLQEFLDKFHTMPVQLTTILLFDSDHLSPASLFTGLSRKIRKAIPGIPLGGGTDANFTELNRNRPDPACLDFLSYTICPQVHATDTLSVVENLAAQPETVSSAAAFSRLPVHIGAVTLTQRFNPVATDASGTGTGPDQGPANNPADPRQFTLFGASWTLGSLHMLMQAGVRSVTFHETTGTRGILDTSGKKPVITPLFHLLKALTAGDYSHAVHTESSSPLHCDGMMLEGPGGPELFLVNFSGSQVPVNLPGMPGRPVRTLKLSPAGWEKSHPGQPDANRVELAPEGIYRLLFAGQDH